MSETTAEILPKGTRVRINWPVSPFHDMRGTVHQAIEHEKGFVTVWVVFSASGASIDFPASMVVRDTDPEERWLVLVWEAKSDRWLVSGTQYTTEEAARTLRDVYRKQGRKARLIHTTDGA
jgi:hypothetical protein